MSTSIGAEGLDVDELGHVLVKLSDEPSEQWMEAFREYWADAGTALAQGQDRRVLALLREDHCLSWH